MLSLVRVKTAKNLCLSSRARKDGEEGDGEEADQRVLSTDGEKAWSFQIIQHSL